MTDEVRVVLVDTVAAAAAAGRAASSVRRWAHEGRLVRQGTDRQGRALYDLADVYRIASNQRVRVSPLTRRAP